MLVLTTILKDGADQRKRNGKFLFWHHRLFWIYSRCVDLFCCLQNFLKSFIIFIKTLVKFGIILSNKQKRTKNSSNRWGNVWATDKPFISLKVMMKNKNPRQMYRVKGEYSIYKSLNKMHASERIRWKSGDQNKYCSNGLEQDEEETMNEEMIKEQNTRSGIHFQQRTQSYFEIQYRVQMQSKQQPKKWVLLALKIHNSKVAWQRRKIFFSEVYTIHLPANALYILWI